MKPSHFAAKRFMKKVLGMFLVVVMLASIGILPPSKVQAAGTTVTSMEYFSPVDGPVISKSGLARPATDLLCLSSMEAPRHGMMFTVM